MIRLRTALSLARAETRRAHGTLSFCVLAIAIGVLAITAIRTLTDGLRQGIEGQAQRLLGADLVISGSEPLDTRMRPLMPAKLATLANSRAWLSSMELTSRSLVRCT